MHMRKDKAHKIHTIHKYFTAIGAVLITVFCYAFWLSARDPGQHPFTSAQTCTTSATLVNSCRPWIGANSGTYSQAASDLNSQLMFLDKRINNANALTSPGTAVTITKKIDIAHVYQSQGSNLFSSSAKTLLNNSAYSYVMVNWKPMPSGYTWKDAGGANATVNAYIKTAADNVKALGSKKIFLALFHEPENDVSSGNCAANAGGASQGSPAQYVAMWANVRKIFDQEGASGNVVWVMNYMGFSKWNCLVPLLWPGNTKVDWIMWDPYGSGTTGNYNSSISNMYNYLSNNSDAAHAYTTKPWGLNEYGYGSGGGSGFVESGAVQYWKDALTSINNNTFPRISMYDVFDTGLNNAHSYVGIDVGTGGTAVPKQTAYNNFVTTVLAKGTPVPPPPDTTRPSVSVTSPGNGTTVSGTINVTASASDNVGVTHVILHVDYVAIKDDTDASDGWSTSWNSTAVGNGSHTVKAAAYDAAGNTTSATNSIVVNNSSGTPAPPPPPPAAPQITSFTATPPSITSGDTSTLAWSATNVVTNGCNLTPSPLSSTSATNQWTTPPLTTSTSYTLTCKNSANATTSMSVSVFVDDAPAPPPPPPVPPTTIDPGGDTTGDPTITTSDGQQVTDAAVDNSITQGDLTTLDPSTIFNPSPIVRVEFYNGSALIQTATKEPFALDTNVLKPGNYTITQKTYFDDGSMSQKTQLITIKAKKTASVGHGSSSIWWAIAVGLVVSAAIVFVARRLLLRHLRSSPSSTDPYAVVLPKHPSSGTDDDPDLRQYR